MKCAIYIYKGFLGKRRYYFICVVLCRYDCHNSSLLTDMVWYPANVISTPPIQYHPSNPLEPPNAKNAKILTKGTP